MIQYYLQQWTKLFFNTISHHPVLASQPAIADKETKIEIETVRVEVEVPKPPPLTAIDEFRINLFRTIEEHLQLSQIYNGSKLKNLDSALFFMKLIRQIALTISDSSTLSPTEHQMITDYFQIISEMEEFFLSYKTNLSKNNRIFFGQSTAYKLGIPCNSNGRTIRNRKNDCNQSFIRK